MARWEVDARQSDWSITSSQPTAGDADCEYVRRRTALGDPASTLLASLPVRLRHGRLRRAAFALSLDAGRPPANAGAPAAFANPTRRSEPVRDPLRLRTKPTFRGPLQPGRA